MSDPMTVILHMTYDLEPGNGHIECRYAADVDFEDIEMAADSPHTAFGIPKEFIIDDMDIVPVDSRELARPEPSLRDFELGPCGCVDYHMADCPTITG
ncbi:MAG: hypothetical protein DRI65_16605 [Chloroflexota bacterium]|nr:MAG: hypothetical protein DRI65_16605 [Chloroflexota bacterium]